MRIPGGRPVARLEGAATVRAALALAVGGAHALLVAPRYHVGSFDDDASYVLAARALSHGAGFTTKLIVGYPLVAVYPPGWAALLATLDLLWPNQVLAFRLLSLLCFAALFPLTWVYLGRRNLGIGIRVTTLLLLALSPLLATFATMVMPEMAFLVVLLLLLLAEERWEHDRRAATWAGAATVTAAAALIWLKEAGLGLVIGVVAWLLLRRLWRKAAMAAIGPALLYLPVVLARASVGVPLIGSRYSSELGVAPGGILHRVHLAPTALMAYVSDAIPRSIVPTYVSPLPLTGPISALLTILQWTAAPLVAVGFVVWTRRHRDVTSIAVPLYLIETLVFPFTNERRVILVLPVIVAWYAVGAWQLAAALVARANGRAKAVRMAARAGPIGLALLALIALLAQLPRDYLYSLGQNSSAPAGAPYMDLLRALGPPSVAVETDYLWTTALFSGHRTANGAYQARCEWGAIAQAIAADRAGYVLSAALNRPDALPSPCVLPLLAQQRGAVRLYRTTRDQASVFELIGPGTDHPGLRDLTPGAQLTASSPGLTQKPETPQIAGDTGGDYPAAASVDGAMTFTWSWGQSQPVSQVSLGAAGMAGASTGRSGPPTASVVIEMRSSGGAWHLVASSPTAVGADRPSRYLLAQFPKPVEANAIRVTMTGQGTAAVHDLHVLGPAT